MQPSSTQQRLFRAIARSRFLSARAELQVARTIGSKGCARERLEESRNGVERSRRRREGL